MFGLTTTKHLHHACMLYILSCSHMIFCLEEQAICVNKQVYLIRCTYLVQG
uniref:Uncharacterized protein n=1 Tax=Anguilla anguilla TaxID=7936 RepID=A0A0E9UJ03_ANGAN